MSARAFTVALLVCTGVSTTAQAQTAEQKKDASGHHHRGVALFKEGNFSAALSEFRAAYQVIPNAEVLFNIGLCERRLFRYGQALRTLQTYLEQGGSKIKPDRRAAVAIELDAIRQLTADITIDVEGAPAKVSVDQDVVGTSPLPAPVPLGPGEHVVRAEREGCEPDEKRLEVVSGKPQSLRLEPRAMQAAVGLVELSVEAEPREALISVDDGPVLRAPAVFSLAPGNHVVLGKLDGYTPTRLEVLVQPGRSRAVKLLLPRSTTRAPQPPPPEVARGQPAPLRPFPVLGVTLLGTGVVAGGLGAVFAVLASDTSRQVSTLIAGGGTWSDHWASVESDARRSSVVAWALFVGAGVALVTGAVLTAVGLAPEGSTTHATVLLTPDPRGGVLLSCAATF